jgi:cobalt-zinc-cadmium efflux system outer membrane protein
MRIKIVAAAALLLIAAPAARAQQPPAEKASTTKLAALLVEADEHNPRILAARQGWQAVEQVPSQVSTLPDPELMVQHFTVGSPRPFAGYSNSDFAYIGFGVSQDFPYPGKLRLQGEAAKSAAGVARERYEAVRRAVRAEVKADYFQIGYLAQILAILERDGRLLDQIEGAAEIRYRSGQGNQQDVLQAQLEKTKLLGEATTRRAELGQAEAQLKRLLARPQSSPDVLAESAPESRLTATPEELEAAALRTNPEVLAAAQEIQRRKTQVEIAKKDFYPDFSLQYMWQHTADQFRDYYMLTFGVRIPIHRSGRLRPALVQAETEVRQAQSEYQAQLDQTSAELRDQYLAAESTARLLRIYRDGLIPQALASFRAGLAAYQSNQQTFASLLVAYRDVLELEEEYAQSLAGHETAVARLEQLTGLELR